jgi:hypothetical protein
MTPAEVRRRLATALLVDLEPRGFRSKRRFLLRTRNEVVTDSLAILGTRFRGASVTLATVNAGIQCHPLHALLADLDGSKTSEAEATFVRNVGYVMPCSAWHEWEFGGEALDPERLADFVEAVRSCALPFLERFTNYASIREGCRLHGTRMFNLLNIPALE